MRIQAISYMKEEAPVSSAMARKKRMVRSRPGRRGHEGLVEHEGASGNGSFGQRVTDEQVAPAPRPTRSEPRPERHPAHEDRHDEGLRMRRMSEEELQVVRPDRLVDEPCES